MTRRGTTNRNARGSAEDRRRRKQWLLNNGFKRCHYCLLILTLETMTIDRIIPGCQGGTYRRDNIRPACLSCNSSEGGGIRA